MRFGIIICCTCMLATAAAAQQPLDIQAHRGGRALMPENTIPAMINAVNLGARTLELDCVISSDKQVVVSHDVYMSADFMRKPDGSDIDKASEKQYVLYRMTYDSIRTYVEGTRPHPQFPQQAKFATYKPLLSALVDSVEAYTKAHHLKPMYYNMETKCSPDGDNVFHPAPEAFVRLVMGVIKAKGIATRVTIQSFDPRTLVIIHRDYPEMKTALLIANKEPFETNISNLGFKPTIYSPAYNLVTAALVKEAHAQGVKVLPWTVNTAQDMQAQAGLGVDGIITDDPATLVKLFGSYQAK